MNKFYPTNLSENFFRTGFEKRPPKGIGENHGASGNGKKAAMAGVRKQMRQILSITADFTDFNSGFHHKIDNPHFNFHPSSRYRRCGYNKARKYERCISTQ